VGAGGVEPPSSSCQGAREVRNDLRCMLESAPGAGLMPAR
jgi:hypothetical protein